MAGDARSSLQAKLTGLVAFRLAIAAVALATIASSDVVFDPDETLRLSAGIAHLIAFPLGYASAVLMPPIVRRTWRRADAGARCRRDDGRRRNASRARTRSTR